MPVVRAVVADLTTWPSWLDVVTDAVADGPAAWRTRLGLRLGPVSFGRAVRLALVGDAPDALRFERVETDGRTDHSPVVLDVALADLGDGTVALDLDVLVGKRVPLLDLQKELDRRARRATERLQALVDARPG
jgi:hypothetical protein